MNQYYNDILNQYQNKLMPQKTPQQISEEQRIQAYQVFITTKEGIAAIEDLNVKFSAWFDETHGTKHSVQATDVKELKEMVSAMAKQIEALNNQLK